MKYRWIQNLKSPQTLLQALILAVAIAPLVGMGLWVYNKHQWARQQLETVEPRYARMLGMREQQDEIETTLQTLQVRRAQYTYSGTEASAQVGAAVQQKLRSLMGAAGLTVTSSQVQVKPAEEESHYEKIVIAMTAEGEMNNVHTALQGLVEVRPAVLVDELSISRTGNLYTAAALQKAPMLNAQFVISILKSKGE